MTYIILADNFPKANKYVEEQIMNTLPTGAHTFQIVLEDNPKMLVGIEGPVEVHNLTGKHYPKVAERLAIIGVACK